MVFLGNDFVYGVMVIKRHKGEASLLPSGAFLHDVNAFNLSILLKVFADVVLLGVLLDTANKDLLHCQMGTWFIRVLSGHGPLGLHNSSVYFMRPCFHSLVDFPHRGVCYKAKPS